MSIGEVAYAAALFQSGLAQRMADPATLGEFSQFSTAPGADWSGFDPDHATTRARPAAKNDQADMGPGPSVTSEESVTRSEPSRPQPVAPENYYDSVPGIAHIDRKSTRLNSSHVAISYSGLCL